MDVSQPILFFDSGVGGLSVLAPTRRLLPAAPLVYVADNGGFPYGTRTEAEIAARVPALLGRLVERYRPRLVVIACNTARSEEHTSELQSLMRISYAVFCLKKKKEQLHNQQDK